MTGAASATDDWASGSAVWAGGAAPAPASTITFTQHHAAVTVTVTRHASARRATHLTLTRAACQVSPVPRQRPPRLTIHGPEWRVARQDVQILLAQQAWHTVGLLTNLTGHLRRCGQARTAHLERLAFVLGPPSQPLTAFLKHHWSVFVPCGPDTWTLTPWVRLDVPFTPVFGPYELEAARFWVTHGYQPSEQEEWNEAVRAHVAHHLTTAPLPQYFRSDPYGGFQRADVGRWRRVSLVIDALPEGVYWTRGDVTFSITGRALIRETAKGLVVVTGLLERRFREVLLNPEAVTMHPAGAAFVAACRAARVEALPI